MRNLPALLSLVFAAACLAGCGEARPPVQPAEKRMVLLGIDGMDPGFLEKHWHQLPNLARLRREGDFRRLATTTPPQSPVAWSTFITGLAPSGHGVYDFVHRDPVTRQPLSSMAETVPGRSLSIGPYLLPITGSRVRSLRRGIPFWQMLADQSVPVTVLRMPTDFPPVDCDAHSISGMGVPDLRGSFGTFAFFTDDPAWKGRKITGGEIFDARLGNHRATLRVPGPVNPLRKDQSPAHIDINAFVDPEEPVARFDVGERRIILRQGEWSEWIPVSFPLLPPFASASGMIRIYAKQLHPRFAVYVSPVNIDPADPSLPISEPESFSRELAERSGRFYTQGMPYDTAALRHGVFTVQEYLDHSRQVSEQALSLLKSSLAGFAEGLLLFHFFGVDQDSHMLWARYDDELLKTYQLVDEMLGWVREEAEDATVVVMSDHGFSSFDRAVHLNTWLMREGLLTLRTADGNSAATLADIDWSRTKAYAVGLNALYVNQQFRESDGIVAEGEETEVLLKQLADRLRKFRDPSTGANVVDTVQVAAQSEVEARDRRPDLIVGYAPGYRASWQTALGEVPDQVIEDNRDQWRGDHCINPEAVPGVLMSTRRIVLDDPRLNDATVTILNEFGVHKTEAMEGRSFFEHR